MAVGDGVVWAESLPDNSTLAHQIDDYNRDLRIGVRSRMAREHIWESSQTGTSEGGQHRYVTFQQQTAAPSLGVVGTVSTQVGALFVGSSGDGYPLCFENSAGTTFPIITAVSSAGTFTYGMAVVSGGTYGAIPICSSANPSTLVLISPAPTTTGTAYLLVSSNNTTGGIQAPSFVTPADAFVGTGNTIGATNISAILGAWESKSNDTVYEAETDGFVCAGGQALTTCSGYTDSSTPPTTLRAFNWSTSGVNASIMMPVKKGDYWKVVGGEVWCYWIPLGA